jgi:hypothetical protein
MTFTAREQALNATWCALCAAMRYSYCGTAYANPHAATQTGDGHSTTTLQYDNNGNLNQKNVDGVITSYEYDYAKRDYMRQVQQLKCIEFLDKTR